MGLRIKESQYGELVSLISFATCDNDCENCSWKNDGNYNFAEYPCLLMELKDIVPNEKVEQEFDDKLDYLKNKKH
jgi:hypothetical protein